MIAWLYLLLALALTTILALMLGFLIGRRTHASNRYTQGGKAGRPRRPDRPSSAPKNRSTATSTANGGDVELYVGNLSYDMTEEQLRQAFEQYGTVSSARVIAHRLNKRSKGFGFVIMPERAQAMAAIAGLHDSDVMGRKMRVNEARGKTQQD